MDARTRNCDSVRPPLNTYLAALLHPSLNLLPCLSFSLLIEVLERQTEVGKFDPGLGFVYSIDGRGQEALAELSRDILTELKANSV